MAYLLEVAGHGERAREVFHRLLKEHPQSRHVPDAYLSFADFFFVLYVKEAAYAAVLAWQNANYQNDADLHQRPRTGV